MHHKGGLCQLFHVEACGCRLFMILPRSEVSPGSLLSTWALPGPHCPQDTLMSATSRSWAWGSESASPELRAHHTIQHSMLISVATCMCVKYHRS
jgi:hypothetical protein